MADETDNKTTPVTDENGQATADSPQFGIVGQYVRDLSFENPNAPNSLVPGKVNPGSNVNINVQVKKQSDELYAVEIGLNVKTERDDTVLYAVELVYGGLFRTKNFPENQLGPLLMVEAPRLLFPFARQVLASTIQAGGFPPLLLDPVDFLALYRRNLAAAREKSGEAGATTETSASQTVN